jgi:hypothetical protein
MEPPPGDPPGKKPEKPKPPDDPLAALIDKFADEVEPVKPDQGEAQPLADTPPPQEKL